MTPEATDYIYRTRELIAQMQKHGGDPYQIECLKAAIRAVQESQRRKSVDQL